ncbi:MAG: LacI family DNA-binding transcriptional regulator [Deltaproteobacteria bacterium]|nr:LacI family DNA-binding transcriptional regulator [Deltaproteobacteria bacterium]
MATMKDVAEAAGISIGTVDRIIHNRGRYSEETAELVRKSMKELNYTPNIHARGLKQTKKHIFSVVLPHREQDGGYWRLVEEGILKAADELISFGNDIRIFPFDRYSSSSCIDALSGALSTDTEGMLIAPCRPDDMRALLEHTNIPYIFIDTNIPDLKRRTAYIGQDSRQSGILAGKLMSLLIARNASTGQDQYVLVVDPPGSNFHLNNRIEGFRYYMDAVMPEIGLMTLKAEADDELHFHRRLKEFQTKNHLLPIGIFAANSSVYYIASFLEKEGDECSSIPLIGYDIIPGRESAVERGTIDFILTQQPEIQGYRGIIMLYDHIVLKKEVNKEVIMPLNIITRENIHTFTGYVNG